jgi:hypothetical protein
MALLALRSELLQNFLAIISSPCNKLIAFYLLAEYQSTGSDPNVLWILHQNYFSRKYASNLVNKKIEEKRVAMTMRYNNIN